MCTGSFSFLCFAAESSLTQILLQVYFVVKQLYVLYNLGPLVP